MYYVRAKKSAVAKDISGKQVNWVDGDVKPISDSDLNYFKTHTDVFEIIDNINSLPIQMGNELATLPIGQPVGITRPCQTIGKKSIGFDAATAWTVVNGVPGTDFTLTNDVTGFDTNGNVTDITSRTGTTKMMKITKLLDNLVRIRKQGISISANGRMGLWVYLDAGSITSTGITIEVGSVNGSGAASYNFNANQMKPNAWNFLVFARNANPTSAADIEAHPFGLTETFPDFGSAQWVTNPVQTIFISLFGTTNVTFYLDSMWHGWETTAQFVLGADQTGADTINFVLPKFNQYGWKGYIAEPFRVQSGGFVEVTDFTLKGVSAALDAVYKAGWDIINHSTNHQAIGALTNAAEIKYEINSCRAWLLSIGYTRGSEFYASPVSSTSVLSRKVIKDIGIKLQRHGAHDANHVTPWGVDELAWVGSLDIGSNTFNYFSVNPTLYPFNYPHIQNLRTWVDMIIKYGATGMPFWHGVISLGDPGNGTGNTGNPLAMYKSNFDLMMDYIAEKEKQGLCRVVDGYTGFYYGVGR